MTSDAVGSEFLSRTLGYKIEAGNFGESSQNLPMRVVILGEANTANQAALDINEVEVTSAQQAGDEYGFGSPLHSVMRILRPVNGGGIGGIPTIVIAQAVDGGAAEKVIDLTPTGAVTGNGTHTIIIAGRNGVDGQSYDINIVTTDTIATLTAKISDAINGVLGSPMSCIDTALKNTLSSKWKGLTADGLNVTVDTNGDDLGISYATLSVTSGSGTPSVQPALDKFGEAWTTIVLNGYGTEAATMSLLEVFNGRPTAQPTGRYRGLVFKPFIAITGDLDEDPSTHTDARLLDVTIAIAPAPLSQGQHYEAAANMTLKFARKVQDNPHLDVGGDFYDDMPTPAEIGAMGDYVNRDAISKKGCSTVSLNQGLYLIQDFITTYHKAGEVPLQFKYCRNLMIDFNVKFGYRLLEIINVVDHVIATDQASVDAPKVIKPKMWKAVLYGYADRLELRALIARADFMKDKLTVAVSSSNPTRFETRFRYERTSMARIAATTAVAGFNFGDN